MSSSSDPTLPFHPLYQAMVKAIAYEHAVLVADLRDPDALNVATVRADRAVAAHNKAVAEYRAQPLVGRPNALPGQPRSKWTA